MLEGLESEVGRLSPVQKILLGTDGSVTQMLEVITGKPVEITTRLQEVVNADEKTAGRLGIGVGEEVNHRVVELRNAGDGGVLIYAVSDTPLSRLSPEFRDDLMRADIPIGRIMKRHHLESRREIIDAQVLTADDDLSRVFGLFRHESLLSRRYQIIHQEQPLISIEEIFPYHSFADERRVIVEAPSRIHLGLIDMHGGLARVDGGIGITLDDPGIVLDAKVCDRLVVHGEGGDCLDVVQKAADLVLAGMGLKCGAEITLRTSYPRHIGLGSGTQLALATARALCELYGQPLPARDLAVLVGRGGTSGIGTAAFESGGFIIDGGHSFGESGDKTGFSPSSASRGVRPAPVTVRHEFPEDWQILLAIPEIARGASGGEELDIFRSACPVPIDEVREVCHEVLVRMLPGLVEHDLDLFGSAVNRIQDIGFKKVEMGLQPPVISGLIGVMRDTGAAGAGMSSFGPTLYAVTDTGIRGIEQASEKFMDDLGVPGMTFITSARNTGAAVRLT